MTNAQAVATINRVEAQMIAEMTKAEYAEYMAIPAEDRKIMLYVAFKMAQA